MKSFIRFIVFSLLIVVYLLITSSSETAAAPKKLYIGAYVGPDSAVKAVGYGGGGWDNDLAYSADRAMVAWQGKNFAVEQTFMSADYATPDLDVITYMELENIWYYGRVPMVNLTFDSLFDCTGGKSLVTLANNLNNPLSADYKSLQKWAKGLKDWLLLGNKRFLILAFVQEANYSSCYPSKPDYVNPDAFINVYRRGKGIVDSVLSASPNAVDVSRVQWAFAPNNESNQSMPGFESYYPGDDVVDWLGLSAYNYGGYHIPGWTFPWLNFDSMARPYLDRMRLLAPQKPLALFQTGSVSFGGDKNQWIQQFIHDALDYPYLFLVVYFNTISPWDGGFAPGFDWPLFWNDSYSASLVNGYGPVPSVNYPVPPGLRYTGWLTAIAENDPDLVFSPIWPMPVACKFACKVNCPNFLYLDAGGNPVCTPYTTNWDIQGTAVAISNAYNLLPELKDGSFLLNNGCDYLISPTSRDLGPGGGAGSLSVNSLAGCGWTAVSNVTWIHITAGSSGSGSGTVSYSVDANAGVPQRTGTATIAGQTFSVNQAGVSPTAGFTFSPAFGTAPVNVSFTNTSSNAASWSWDFGDGAVSSSQSPSHNFSTQGIYTVTLTASNVNGSNSISKTISSCGTNPAKIVRIGSPYSSFLNAYAAATVAHDEIRMHAATLVGGHLDGDVPVTLVGGNDCSFNRLPGLMTTLSGLLTISGNAEITFDGIIIQ